MRRNIPKWKRCICLALAVLMTLPFAPMTALAEQFWPEGPACLKTQGQKVLSALEELKLKAGSVAGIE